MCDAAALHKYHCTIKRYIRCTETLINLNASNVLSIYNLTHEHAVIWLHSFDISSILTGLYIRTFYNSLI